ncbi:MAG: Uncharacterized protein FD133_1739 [Erysipelotrichaceae bacterium]|nr:MAG: Uncharacterized protein FD133_1739 [Erysipelotrichaceae bacterium]
MNRYDKGLVIFILISSLLMYTTMEWFVRYTTSDQIVAVVYSYDKEVLRIDLNVDKVYEVEGTLGIVFIEVENKRIRVEKETSPYHLCSIQGWVDLVDHAFGDEHLTAYD